MNKKRLAGLIVVLALVIVAGGALASGLLTRDLTGEMEFVDMEGGYWAVVSEGERYIPVNLSDEFMVEGLKVSFKVVDQPDVMGIHMSGTYVEILE